MFYLNDAIAACEHALHHQLEVTSAYRVLGNVLQAMGKFDQALHWHTRSIGTARSSTIAPQFTPQRVTFQTALAEDYIQLGNLHTAQQRWQQAIGAYQTALSLNPDAADAHWGLADALSEIGKAAEALPAWEQALILEPQRATAAGHCSLGDRFLQQGNPQRAIGCYHRALQQNPKDATTHHHLAEVLRSTEQWQDAIFHYRQSIEHDPQFPWSRYSLADLLLQQEQWDEAIALSESTIALKPLPWAYSQLGRALVQKGRFDDAIDCHQQGCAARGWHRCRAHNYQFTRDWFSHNIPVWQAHLQAIAQAPQIAALEIGGYEGMASCWLLDHVLTHPASRLTCLVLDFQEQFQANVAKTAAAEKVTTLSGNSHEVLPLLPENAYDVVYLDGWSVASHVQQDAVLAWRLLKDGGVMIFDDYQWVDSRYPEHAPKWGIDAFMAAFQQDMTLLHQSYQVIVQKVPATARRLQTLEEGQWSV